MTPVTNAIRLPALLQAPLSLSRRVFPWVSRWSRPRWWRSPTAVASCSWWATPSSCPPPCSPAPPSTTGEPTRAQGPVSDASPLNPSGLFVVHFWLVADGVLETSRSLGYPLVAHVVAGAVLPPGLLLPDARPWWAWCRYGTSLFKRLQGAGYPVVMLRTQYRMHPAIRHFPSKEFYQGALVDGDAVAKQTHRPWHQHRCFGPFAFFDIAGEEEQAEVSTPPLSRTSAVKKAADDRWVPCCFSFDHGCFLLCRYLRKRGLPVRFCPLHLATEQFLWNTWAACEKKTGERHRILANRVGFSTPGVKHGVSSSLRVGC